jgi:hypothetical protein
VFRETRVLRVTKDLLEIRGFKAFREFRVNKAPQANRGRPEIPDPLGNRARRDLRAIKVQMAIPGLLVIQENKDPSEIKGPGAIPERMGRQEQTAKKETKDLPETKAKLETKARRETRAPLATKVQWESKALLGIRD